ncbi:MAG: NYN domain-containing protein [Dehalococcoidia bacterium]|nr:NYN domain-containing protein [Dehalococcoidia bacterium]
MLIDGDNAQPSLIADVLAETAKYGVVTTRRIYGDWTTPQMSGWKDTLHSHAVQPVQQFRYTTGKNATDSALIIDAMDLLHVGNVAGFCIVSSDSDYTRLATRIREQGLFVMGVGKSQTPKPFVNACEIFVYTENLGPQSKSERPTATVSRSDDWTKMVSQAIDMGLQDDGWAFLGAVGSHLRQLDSAFDPRTYGHKQLSLLIKSRSDLFEMREPKTKSGPALLYVRLKAESRKAS